MYILLLLLYCVHDAYTDGENHAVRAYGGLNLTPVPYTHVDPRTTVIRITVDDFVRYHRVNCCHTVHNITICVIIILNVRTSGDDHAVVRAAKTQFTRFNRQSRFPIAHCTHVEFRYDRRDNGP